VGTAHFRDPGGSVTGPTTAHFDSEGERSAIMRVRRATCDEDLPGGLCQPLHGGEAIKLGTGFSMGIGFTTNTCDKLLINTRHGEVSEEGRIIYDPAYAGKNTTITFHVLRPALRIRSRKKAKYWVMPLLNFVSEYALHYPQLDDHPLRLVHPPGVPSGLTEQERLVAEYNASLKNRLIAFELDGKPGFIEPLPDHASREKDLKEGRERCLVTAVMVGEVSNRVPPSAELRRWLPFGLLQLLSLTTGSKVGFPWVEFRDADGQLLRRVHVSSGRLSYTRGHAIMREWIHRGTGYLLSRAAASGKLDAEPTSLVLNLLIAASSYSGYIEDRFDCLFRAIEALCRYYDLKRPAPLVSDPCRTKVAAILQQASAEVVRLKTINPDFAAALGRISARIGQAATPNPRYGDMLVSLLDKFGLPDGEVMRAYSRRRHRRYDWPQQIERIRHKLTHEGSLGLERRDLDKAMATLNHLLDIMLRIVFKMLDYDGHYQPPCLLGTADPAVDWVKPTTQARSLGYR
jgi:hypothetical protein